MQQQAEGSAEINIQLISNIQLIFKQLYRWVSAGKT